MAYLCFKTMHTDDIRADDAIQQLNRGDMSILVNPTLKIAITGHVVGRNNMMHGEPCMNRLPIRVCCSKLDLGHFYDAFVDDVLEISKHIETIYLMNNESDVECNMRWAALSDLFLQCSQVTDYIASVFFSNHEYVIIWLAYDE